MKKGPEKFREWEWEKYKKWRYSRLKSTDFTIISSNCVGTVIYYDLGLPFLSPTINLTIGMNDFVKFAENLKWYMERKIEEVEDKSGVPTGLLGDIKVHFVHYKNFEEGRVKWKERKQRINWDNLFFIGSERGDCTYETVRRFDQLPYKNKVIFTHLRYRGIESAFYIKGFEKENELGPVLSFKDQFIKRRYLDDFDYIRFLNASKLRNR
nr:DUF1919 domain-containing protein [uncultured Schaedlerella sp.]